jgi:hypothetical protein
MLAVGSREVWNWTAYGISSGGMEDPLEEAQAKFITAYEANRRVGREPRVFTLVTKAQISPD